MTKRHVDTLLFCLATSARAGTWQSIGPDGRADHRLRQPSRVYAALCDRGLWRSDDRGLSDDGTFGRRSIGK
jgi:hypothetical protein